MTTDVVVNRITLFSTDMDKTAEFYKAIGLNLQKSGSWSGCYNYLDIMQNNEQNIIFEIYPLIPDFAISPQNLGFEVESLPEIIEKLMEMKAPLVRPKVLAQDTALGQAVRSDCTYAVFKDPDGRVVSLTQHDKVKPT